MTFQRHDVSWTPEKIKNFWDYIADNPALSRLYFTHEVGYGVARDIAATVKLDGKKVLDFGCGPGNLFKGLVKYAPGIHYYGADFSPSSVESMHKDFGANTAFKGSFVINDFPTAISETFDVIVCCEVVEHLDDATLANVYREFARLLNPGGTLYITTPNEEDLNGARVMCPDCGGVFHRWQHQRSWSARTLSDSLKPFGIRESSSEVLTYSNRPFLGDLKTFAKRLLKKKVLSLKWVGTKA